MNNKKNMRRVSVLVSAQTLWNLGRLAKMAKLSLDYYIKESLRVEMEKAK